MVVLVGMIGCEAARAGDVPAARAVPNWYGRSLVKAYVGRPQAPKPVAGTPPPQHPYMAAHGANNMHGDSYASGTYAASGPLGKNPTVTSAAYAPLGGLCAALTFDARGRIVTVCGGFSAFNLRVLDPRTLGEYTSLKLPPRASTWQAALTFDLQKIFTDTSGGAYFFLDNRDRIVLVDAHQTLRIIGIHETEQGLKLVDEASYPLAGYLSQRDCFSFPHHLFPRGRCDAVTAVLPDWDGYYWWVSRYGIVGTVDPATGTVRTIQLDGEEIQNSFAVAAGGVYIVSDYAMYGFRRGSDGTPRVKWREAYTRAAAARPGQINLGSGTSPTLIGDDLVVIADGADPTDVLFINRTPDFTAHRTLCKVPVFEKGHSATDNSLIGFGNSVIVENNYGYRNFTSLLFGKATVGGIARVDISEDRSHCRTIWVSHERAPSCVPKLSRRNGLVYVYTKDPQPWGVDAWYFTAIDFETGRTVYKVLTGTGWGYDNLWAPITIGPDGTGYSGVFNGLVAVRDEAP
ncbi:MAG: hypothetical protein ACE5I7_15785 [Candidatus Binatia bacterium]